MKSNRLIQSWTTLWVACCLAAVVPLSTKADPVTLQNATASYAYTSGSYPDFLISKTIDGVTGSSLLNGWQVYPNSKTNHTAVYETATDINLSGGGTLTFKLFQLYGDNYTMGRLRLSVTTDNRSTFADGLNSGGDVTATWTQLTPISATSLNGTTLTIQGDNSVLASGASPATDVYTVVAPATLVGITGVRLEALTDASLGGFVGRAANGTFLLQEFQVDFVPEPSSMVLLALGGLLLARKRW